MSAGLFVTVSAPSQTQSAANTDRIEETTSTIRYLKTAYPIEHRFGVWGPKAKKSAPTLFIFAGTVEESLGDPYFRQCGNALGEKGYLCVSLDLPCHGKDHRPEEPEGLSGWRFRAGHEEDFTGLFVLQASEVLNYLVANGSSDPDRIAACGTSRGGYMALRFAASDKRVGCVAAFAPVTDLLALREFQGVEKTEFAESLGLMNFASGLADRPVWMVIGDRDHRVGTDNVIAFGRAVSRESEARGIPGGVELHVLPEPKGHTTPAGSSEKAAQWITKNFELPDRRP